MKRAVVILAEGFEEIEAVSPIDVLRRSGTEVVVAGIGSDKITGANGLEINCNIKLEDLNESFDLVVTPGGMPGAENIANSDRALKLIKETYDNGGWVAAICASPGVVLSKTGLLEGKTFTCYPGFEKYNPKGKFSEERVVTDSRIITSRGPATSLEFALEIVKNIVSPEKAAELKEGMLVNFYQW